MARRGDGLYLRGKTWLLDCRIDGRRRVVKLGKGITRTVASELASIKRAGILKGDAGIGKKRKDTPFEKAKDAFLDWTVTNKRPRTACVYRQARARLASSFGQKTLGRSTLLTLSATSGTGPRRARAFKPTEKWQS